MPRIAIILALLLPLAATGAELSAQGGRLRATAAAQAEQPMDEVEEDAADDKVPEQLSANPDENDDLLEAKERAEEKAANGDVVPTGSDLVLAAEDSKEDATGEAYDEDDEPTDAELGLEDDAEEPPAAEEDDMEDGEAPSLLEIGMQKKSADDEEDSLEDDEEGAAESPDAEGTTGSDIDEAIALNAEHDTEGTEASEDLGQELEEEDEEDDEDSEMQQEDNSPVMAEKDEIEEEGNTVMLKGQDAMSVDLEADEGEQEGETALAGKLDDDDEEEPAEEA